jgi:uncharacterized membrane protein YphA (DoxX/SURF4 family)
MMDWLLGGRGRDWAPVPVRLILGAGFVVHGYPKLFTQKGHGDLADQLSGFGIPGSELAAWTVGIIEVNLLYIAGFLMLILGGAGVLSIDHLLRERRHEHLG